MEPTMSPTNDPTAPTSGPTASPTSAAPTPSPTPTSEGAGADSSSSSGFDEVDWRSLALGAILASLFICCLFWILIFIFWKKRNEVSTDESAMTQMTSTGAEAGV